LSRKRVFLYVQHLLGIGHFKRAAALARAMAAAGLEVTLASGGAEAPGLALEGVRLVQLPPARAADSRFTVLVDGAGRPIDEAWRARRREALLGACRAAAPHALLIELFPFGRRQMRFELEPLLGEALRAPRRPVIVSSVRDVLGGGRREPSRQDEMLERFERFFDHLLVHGDPAFLPFERTFRHAARLGPKLHYTGYVVERPSPGEGERAGEQEILVSAGGGAVGERLLETAIGCRALSVAANHIWRVLAGVNAADDALARLERLAAGFGAGRVIVERARADFAARLRHCALSLSQAGYNTMMEVLDAGARAVAVPFAGGAETEQLLRARALAERGRIELVEEAALSPPSLAAAVDRALARPRPAPGGVDLGGAQRSAELLVRWVEDLSW
jgi:predicted glycosyltransferase